MGFSDNFKKIGPTSKLYNRIGNSIAVPMVERIAEEVKNQLFNKEYEFNSIPEPIPKPQPQQMNLFECCAMKQANLNPAE